MLRHDLHLPASKQHLFLLQLVTPIHPHLFNVLMYTMPHCSRFRRAHPSKRNKKLGQTYSPAHKADAAVQRSTA